MQLIILGVNFFMVAARILQVVPRLDSGGAEQSTLEIVKALVHAKASALVASEGGRLVGTIVRAGGEVVSLPVASKNPLTVIANVLRLERLIDDWSVQLVHARSRAPAWSAWFAALRTRRPFVTTYHGTYGNPGPLKTMYNSIMSRGDRIIANSQYTANLIALRHPTARERIRIVYRGIDSVTFDPLRVAASSAARLRKRWGISPGAKVVLLAARLTSLKGHHQTIEAAAKLDRDGALNDVVFVLAGDVASKQSYRQELVSLIARNELENKILLVGHCTDMPAAFLMAHVTIVPSLVPETFGRTSIEAQAMGCPVIVSNIGALPETISTDREYTGWLVPPGDAAALADMIAVALSLTESERSVIGKRARARVKEEFQLAQMQAKTLSVYDELLGTQLADQFSQQFSHMKTSSSFDQP